MKHSVVVAAAAFLALLPPAKGQGFGPQQVITTQTDTPRDVLTADLDGDGDLDVLTASQVSGQVAWYENHGVGVFGTQHVISTLANHARSVHAADLDGDGDIDVLSASGGASPLIASKVAWYENLGGGSFGPQLLITTQVDTPFSVSAGDLDGDGDADVLSASHNDDKIAWYENFGGGSFGVQQLVTVQANGASMVHPADLDGDGDLDILSASENDGKVAWYENHGGGVFGPQQVITTSVSTASARSVYALDLDADGDTDVLSASYLDDKIAWYANLGSSTFGAQQVITTEADGATDVYAADLDGDGYMDVLSASHTDDKIAWYQNLGGATFGGQQVISLQADSAVAVHVADLDGDGDLDVLSASELYDKIAWYPNLMGPFDCNGNGVSDAQDIGLGTSGDCNANGVPDECDLASGFSIDIDGDGLPDGCIAPPLMADTYELSVAAGGTQTFSLTAPVSFALYLLLGTASGTSPGTPSGGFVIPLNVDAYLIHTALSPNVAPLASSFGALTPSGSSGTATASFALPAAFSPSLVGLTVHHAYVTIEFLSGSLSFVSNPVPLALLP